jgi:hypothetical protein
MSRNPGRQSGGLPLGFYVEPNSVMGTVSLKIWPKILKAG